MRATYSHVAGIFSPNYRVDQWEWCQRLNGTYLDCPVATRTAESFAVFVHNPSQVTSKYLRVKTPHAHYDVYEQDLDKKTNLPAEAICLNKFLENGTHIYDCDFFVTKEVTSTNIIVFEYNPNVNRVINVTAEPPLAIKNDVETFTYLG